MRAVDPRVGFAELEQWPDDGRRYELYDGEVVVVASPFPRHQRIAQHVGEILAEYEHAAGGIVFDAPIDIVLSEYDVVQPDVVFFRRSRRHLIDMWQAVRVAPDLAVEVLSCSTEACDRGRKMELLARSGVPEYWIVDPIGRTIEVYAHSAGAYDCAGLYGEHDEVRSATLCDLRFQAGRVFRE